MKDGFFTVHYQSMTCVIATLEADDDSASSVKRSTTLPLPSSPHWAPMIATLAIVLFLDFRFGLGNQIRVSPAPPIRFPVGRVALGAPSYSRHRQRG